MTGVSEKTDVNDVSDVQNVFELLLAYSCWNKFKVNEIISQIIENTKCRILLTQFLNFYFSDMRITYLYLLILCNLNLHFFL